MITPADKRAFGGLKGDSKITSPWLKVEHKDADDSNDVGDDNDSMREGDNDGGGAMVFWFFSKIALRG